jgi:hypothetical protein
VAGIMTNKFDRILEIIICNTITILCACLVMLVADLCVLLIAATATFLFGYQTYNIIPLETLMFMTSAVVGATYIIGSRIILYRPVFPEEMKRWFK